MRYKHWATLAVFAAALIGGIVYKYNRASSDIAFMGDSLTEGWSFPRVNLGKHGQTTGEMLSLIEDTSTS